MSEEEAQTRSIVKSLRPDLERYVPAIAKLTSDEKAKRMVSMVLHFANKEPKILQCKKESIVSCMMAAAELNLDMSPTMGKFYLIPRGDTCTFQIGYKGLLELVHASGVTTSFSAQVVREGDFFDCELGDNPFLKHKPDFLREPEGEIQVSYAIARLKGYDKDEIEVIRKATLLALQKKYNTPAWRDHFAAMARKTAIKALANRLPLGKVTEAIRKEEEQEEQLSQEQPEVTQVHDRPKSANEALSQAIG